MATCSGLPTLNFCGKIFWIVSKDWILSDPNGMNVAFLQKAFLKSENIILMRIYIYTYSIYIYTENIYIYVMYICMCVCYVVWTFGLPPSSFQSSAASCGTRLSRFNKIQGNSLSGLFKPLQRVGHSLSQRWLHDTSFCHVLSTFQNFAGA